MFSTRRKLEENPKVKSNPLSVLSFSYLNNLFKKGAKTPLEAQEKNFKLLKLRVNQSGHWGTNVSPHFPNSSKNISHRFRVITV